MSLSQQTAKFRASAVQKNTITYNYHITLDEQHYQGLAELTFSLQHLNFDQLSIDFQGKITQDVIVNSIRVKADKRQSQVFFRKTLLQRGRNRITIAYENTYDSDLFGCVSYYDKKNQLIYTNFEPYGCNRVFPCFDQPDLKAKIRLTVVTPPTWVVTSCQPVEKTQLFEHESFRKALFIQHKETSQLMSIYVSNIKQNTKATFFDATELIPTYIFCLCAGNYKYITSNTGSVPMTILSSPSSFSLLTQYSKFIFEISQKVMNFYQQFFNQRYPFKKFDQIWIYELTAKAMQNAAICTYDEMYLVRNPTNTNLYDFAQVIAHELGHHWFGNYVTMDWWDDLWLNESFANFISQFALENVNPDLTTIIESPLVNFRDTKTRGYNDDERLTATHAVRGEVIDTNVAWSNFDGIVYGKGAGIMKQLCYLVGRQNFSLAVTKYFDRFGWSNATITDLLNDVEPFLPIGVDMKQWRTSWLETPSLDVFQPVWNPNDKSVSATLTLNHFAFNSNYPILRTHKMKIVFIDASGAIVQSKQVVVPNQSETNITYNGSLNIQAIYINSQDYCFFYNKIDSTSLNYFVQHILEIKDEILRALIWHDINHMVKNGDITLDQYLFMILGHLFEESTMVLDKLLTYLMIYLKGYTSEKGMLEFGQTIFDRIYSELQIVDPGNRRNVLEKHYINYALTDAQILKLVDWIKGQDPNLATRPLTNQDHLWAAVKKAYSVSSLTSVDKEDLFNMVALEFYSSLADNAKIVCDTIIADNFEYENIYNSLKDTKIGLYDKQLLVEGWNNRYHYERYTEQYRDRYFNDIIEVSTILPFQQFKLFYERLRPMDRNFADQVLRYKAIIQQLKPNPEMVAHINNINKIIDDLELNIKNTEANSLVNSILTEEMAKTRAKYIISGVTLNYNCHLAFTEGSEMYQGLTQINFNLISVPAMLPIDILSDEVINVTVNGNSAGYLLRGQFILISGRYLSIGSNKVAVHYKNKFNNDYYGCISYIEDAQTSPKQYIYTNLEPYGAHRVFPCFDQPDLKGTANFNLILSKSSWKASTQRTWDKNAPYNKQNYINNIPVTDTKLLDEYLVGKSGMFWVYPVTKVTPVYAFCVIVGDYTSVTLSTSEQYKAIPMTIYAPQSLSSALTAGSQIIFEITKQCIKYYDEKFGIPYQFYKYDYAFVPNMYDEAMENPGLVTMDQKLLSWFKEGVSLGDMVYFASDIAHECAHFWFGNLVTLRWWNDLWLNQSFADFLTFECLTAIQSNLTKFTYPVELSNMVFLAASDVAYIADQNDNGTHALSSTMQNITLALRNFDGISYQKGSLVLRQLKTLMGETNFYEGLKAFLTAYSFQNADLSQFITVMSTYFNHPNITIDMFRDMWLTSVSFNVLTAEWDPSDLSSTATLTIHQENFSSVHQSLRYHQITVTFFKDDGTTFSQPVLVKAQSDTQIVYDGSQNFVAVLLNSANESFVKCRIDTNSMVFFTNGSLSLVSSAETIMMVWFQLNEMVRDRLIRVDAYKDIVLSQMTNENNDMIYQMVFRFLESASSNFVPASKSQVMRQQIFTYVLNALSALNNSNDVPNRIIILKQLLVTFCTTENQIDIVEQWRRGLYVPLSNITITTEQAWYVVKLVFMSDKYTYNEQTDAYDSQKAKTPGMQAKYALNTCLAIAADDTTMEVLYDTFKEAQSDFPFKYSSVQGWNSGIHLQLLVNKYKPRFFEDLLKLSTVLPDLHFEFFYSKCKPIDEDFSSTAQKLQAIQLQGPGMIGHMRNLKRIIDEYKIRALQLIYNQ